MNKVQSKTMNKNFKIVAQIIKIHPNSNSNNK